MRALTEVVAVTTICVSMVLATSAWAQTTQGRIIGTIRDQNAAAVVGAKVTVTNPATGLQRTTTTANKELITKMLEHSGNRDRQALSLSFG